MKTCSSCGTLNKDDNNFCCGCGAASFTAQSPDAPQQPAPAVPAHIHSQSIPTKYDLFTIFGFVASIIGTFVIALILEPLALTSAIIGFTKGKSLRGLAIAAIVIAVISLLIRLFITLFDMGIIPEWVITGALDS